MDRHQHSPASDTASAERIADVERHEDARARPDEARVALFDGNDAAGFRTRWEAIQTGFVDEPRAAVEQADALVTEVMARLTDGFDRERRELEHQWDNDGKVSTENLRISLRRYRSFFERMLSF